MSLPPLANSKLFFCFREWLGQSDKLRSFLFPACKFELGLQTSYCGTVLTHTHTHTQPAPRSVLCTLPSRFSSFVVSCYLPKAMWECLL